MDKDWEEQEEKIIKKEIKKNKRKKMKVSGKNVFILQEEIKKKGKKNK